jgi:hypothetical protein
MMMTLVVDQMVAAFATGRGTSAASRFSSSSYTNTQEESINCQSAVKNSALKRYRQEIGL